MAKKVNRADILQALLQQLKCNQDSMPSGEMVGMLHLAESIQPVVDVSRPSKIPYADWVWGLKSATGGTIIPAKVDKRIVVTHMQISAKNGATDTGLFANIQGTINGSSGAYLLGASAQGSLAETRDVVSDCEIVVDVNTSVNLALVGTFGTVLAWVLGYYIASSAPATP